MGGIEMKICIAIKYCTSYFGETTLSRLHCRKKSRKTKLALFLVLHHLILFGTMLSNIYIDHHESFMQTLNLQSSLKCKTCKLFKG